MPSTLGAHSLDDLEQRYLFIDAAYRRVDLCWSDPKTHGEFVLSLPFAYDLVADAEDMAGSQSCCGTTTMGALDEVKVDGRVTNFRGQATCNPLAEPYAKRYDAITYLETLGRQRGVLETPSGAERPDIRPGCVVKIGGGPDGNGAEHVIMVTDVRSDGALETVEGGKVDPGNKKPSPKNLTKIEADVRELVQRGGHWYLRDCHSKEEGRRLRWWFAVEKLPLREDA